MTMPWETPGSDSPLAAYEESARTEANQQSPERLVCMHGTPLGGRCEQCCDTNQQSPDEPTCPHGVPLHTDCFKCDEPPLEDVVRDLLATVTAMQADMRFAVKHTAVLVRSSNEALRMVVNTERGQLMPPGVVTFTDSSTVEFQDVGMPQPGCPTMTLPEIVKAVFAKATELGLTIA